MKEIKSEVAIGVEAVDGTVFMFNGNPETAKENCRAYEQSAAGVIFNRLSEVLIRKPKKEIEVEKDTYKPSTTFHIDEDLARMFGYYDCESYIFRPQSQKDIEDLIQLAFLKNCDGTIDEFRKELKLGETHFVIFDCEAQCAIALTEELVKERAKELIERQLLLADVFFNPDAYIYSKNPDGVCGYHLKSKE